VRGGIKKGKKLKKSVVELVEIPNFFGTSTGSVTKILESCLDTIASQSLDNHNNIHKKQGYPVAFSKAKKVWR